MREIGRRRHGRANAATALLAAAALFTSIGVTIDARQGAAPAMAASAPDGVAAIVPVTPARVLDTREPLGVPDAVPLGPEGVVELDVVGRGGVPSTGVGGVVLNVTIVSPTAPTFITVWPSGQPRPTASSLNALPGEVFANLVVAKVGDGGRVSLYNYAGDAHLVADVTGWIPAASELTTVTPARLLDTRDGTGGHLGPVGEDRSVELDVTGVGGVPDDGVTAVLLNVTVTEPTAPSYVTTWPTGEPMPTASSLNMVAGQTIPNLVLAKVGDGGRVSLYNRFGSTHLVADVVGYASEAAAPTIVGLTPARVLDTRDGTGASVGAVAADTAIDLDVIGVGGVPDAGVTGVLLNVTVDAPTAPSFVTTWPNGLPRPLASSLNMVAGQTIPNLVLAPVGAGGEVSLYNYAGDAHLIADVVGYLLAPAGTTAPTIADETVAIGNEQIVSIDGAPDDDETIELALTADADVEIGSILVAEPGPDAPSGLLRRVTSITPGPDGTLVVSAERARLADAVPAGSFAFTAPLSGAEGRLTQSQPMGTTAYNDSLGCGTAARLTSSVDGGIDPSIDVMFDWDASGLHAARIVAGLDVTLNLRAAATLAVSCTANAEVFVVVWSPIVVPIGGFPFAFVPELSLNLGLSGAVEGSVSGSANYSVQLTAGIVYDDTTGTDTIAAVTPRATSTWTATAKATAGATLTPALKLAAYGLGGPEASVPLGVSVDLEPCRRPLWKLTSSVKSKIALALSSWLGNVELAATEFTLSENVIAQGGDPIPDFPGCENKVDVTSYVVESRARTEAERFSQFFDGGGGLTGETTEDDFREVTERYEALKNASTTLGPGIHRKTVDRTDFTDPTTGVTTLIAPFSVSSRTAAADASATTTGATAASSSTASISFDETGDEYTVDIGLTSNTSASADPDIDTPVERTDYSSTSEGYAIARVDFTLTGSRDLSITPCGGEVFYQLSRVTGGVVSDTQTGDCIDDQTLDAGDYFVFVRVVAGSEDDGPSSQGPPTSSVDALITLTK